MSSICDAVQSRSRLVCKQCHLPAHRKDGSLCRALRNTVVVVSFHCENFLFLLLSPSAPSFIGLWILRRTFLLIFCQLSCFKNLLYEGHCKVYFKNLSIYFGWVTFKHKLADSLENLREFWGMISFCENYWLFSVVWWFSMCLLIWFFFPPHLTRRDYSI